MTLLTLFLLLLAVFSAEGVWSDAIYHARHGAVFLSNTFFSCREFTEHIFDEFSNLLDIFILYILLSVNKLTWKLPA